MAQPGPPRHRSGLERGRRTLNQNLHARDIDAFLAGRAGKDTLRFLTCGSVDDGKSTLIGRLLHESKCIFDDQLAALESDSKRYGTQRERIDFALLVDGLQAEREQGITIDVAYRYFATDRRRFIVADTPGHEQYTRNLARRGELKNFTGIDSPYEPPEAAEITLTHADGPPEAAVQRILKYLA
ncbi:MAG: hypothetical protein A3H32_13525 [Betaproteobacteria bacterium RIFCSPLOWO2_02_FULL_63_19]|nr:MAG: hypothetical protein A3H32_13525 [Betaproteobacteria bacterium RIFCSPLOWO2_02_FULL_63_19]